MDPRAWGLQAGCAERHAHALGSAIVLAVVERLAVDLAISELTGVDSVIGGLAEIERVLMIRVWERRSSGIACQPGRATKNAPSMWITYVVA
jgi:hypothetical protein